MDIKTLEECNSLKNKIEHEEKNLRIIERMKQEEIVAITNYHCGSVTIPKELKEVIFTLVEKHYSDKLSKIKEKFEYL